MDLEQTSQQIKAEYLDWIHSLRSPDNTIRSDVSIVLEIMVVGESLSDKCRAADAYYALGYKEGFNVLARVVTETLPLVNDPDTAPSPELLRFFAGVVRCVGSTDACEVPHVLDSALHHAQRSDVRCSILEAYGETRSHYGFAERAFLDYLKGGSQSPECLSALSGLAKIGYCSHSPMGAKRVLAPFLQDPSPSIRAATIRVLGCCATSLDLIRPMALDSDEHVRAEVERALRLYRCDEPEGRVRSPMEERVIGLLQNLLDDEADAGRLPFEYRDDQGNVDMIVTEPDAHAFIVESNNFCLWLYTLYTYAPEEHQVLLALAKLAYELRADEILAEALLPESLPWVVQNISHPLLNRPDAQRMLRYLEKHLRQTIAQLQLLQPDDEWVANYIRIAEHWLEEGFPVQTPEE